MIPGQFKKQMRQMYGSDGDKWIQSLPRFLHEFGQKHECDFGSPYILSYNFVAPLYYHNGKSAVLKVGYSASDLTSELEALRYFQGDRFVRVLEENTEEGWVLLQHLQPGTPLKSVQDDAVTVRVTGEILSSLWKEAPVNHGFLTVKKRADSLHKLREEIAGKAGHLPSRAIDKAQTCFSELLASVSNDYVLHGDLHHGNILYSEENGWTGIDPKGVVGEREYDLIPFLLNEISSEDPIKQLEFRAKSFAEQLQLNYERILMWGYCHSILSGLWCLEDSLDCWENSFVCARNFERLLD
jgi:streptomycin 6-kinase